jgi:hypothetical protein
MEEAKIKISKTNLPKHIGPQPSTCNVCHKDPPVVAMENTNNNNHAWLCEECLKKGFPDFAKEFLSLKQFNEDNASLPEWSGQKDMGG